MISPDLLSVLMRGIQARHLDWGASAEAAQPEGGGFLRFLREESGPAEADQNSSVDQAIPERGESEAVAENSALPESDATVAATGPLPEPEEAGDASDVEAKHVMLSSEAVLVPTQLDPRQPAGDLPPAETGMAADGRAGSRPGTVHPEQSGEANAGGPGRTALMESETERSTESPAGGPRDAADLPQDLPAPAERPAQAASASPAPSLASPGPQGLGAQPVLGDASAGMSFAGGAEHGWRLSVEPGAATASREAAMPAAAAPQGSAHAITGQVALAIRTGDSDRIEIRLDPPELGRVQIEMRVVEGSLHAVVVAERSEVSDLLRRNAELLQRDLEAAGYGSVTLDFAAGHQEGSERRNEAHPNVRAPTALDMAPVAATSVRAALDGRLDIRL